MLEQARDFYHDLLTGFMAGTRHILVFSKGLAAFDPILLLREESDQAHDCFQTLFDTFQQRGWLELRDKPSAILEYESFMSGLKLDHLDSSGILQPIVDVISYFSDHALLNDKVLLKKMFRLVCLCLPLKGVVASNSSLGLEAEELSREAGRSLIMPLHSFLQQVGPSFAFNFNDDAIVECQGVVGSGSLLYCVPEFSPWDHVEFAPREETYDRLQEIYHLIRSSPKKSKELAAPASLIGVIGAPPVAPSDLTGSVARILIAEA